MRKIPTLFVRDPDTGLRYVRDEVHPACRWVLDGQGYATRKYDGTCVLLDEAGAWWARREVKAGKATPAGFVAVEHDPVTGKTVGWEPAAGSSFAKYLAQAVEAAGTGLPPGTYELVGPKVNGNPEGADAHRLVAHATAERLPDAPRDFDGLAKWLRAHPYEGIVWHGGPDGAMAKLKARDFPR